MKVNKVNQTFRQRIQHSNALMCIIIVSCIVLFNIINTISVDRYNETVVSLKSLSSYYENVKTATSYIKDYLYTENKETLDQYEEHIKDAFSDMDALKSAALSQEYFRFVMLENMLTNFHESNAKLIEYYHENKHNYTQAYNDFLRTSTLIEKTSKDYYNLITKAVNTQLDGLKSIKKTTIIGSVLLLGLLILWLIHYSQQLTGSITKPIEMLLKNIKRVKGGEYDLSQVSGASLEMEELCNALNEMAYAVQSNIETTKEKAQLEKLILEWKNENLKKDELLAQSELKMLQNQINPHFLFNTLNMIYKMTMQEGADNAAQILIKTSQLLRYGLDKQNRLSDIKSEVETLQNYIDIQKIRFQEHICFQLQFDNMDVIGNVQIPGMILQPLVENAIKHGFSNCTEGGIIEIIISGDEQEVTIIVSDNGSGMSSDELEQFILHDYQKKDGNHLGLYNVVKRLQMYYQNCVNITINSDLDCGFEIIIQIQLPR